MASCEQHLSIIQESLEALKKERARVAALSLSALCFVSSVVGVARTEDDLTYNTAYHHAKSIDTLKNDDFEDLLGRLTYSPGPLSGTGGSPAYFLSPTMAQRSIENILSGLGYIDPIGVDTIGPQLREIAASLPESCPELATNMPVFDCDFTDQRTKLMGIGEVLKQDRSNYLDKVPSNLVTQKNIFRYGAIFAALICEATALSFLRRSR